MGIFDDLFKDDYQRGKEAGEERESELSKSAPWDFFSGADAAKNDLAEDLTESEEFLEGRKAGEENARKNKERDSSWW